MRLHLGPMTLSSVRTCPRFPTLRCDNSSPRAQVGQVRRQRLVVVARKYLPSGGELLRCCWVCVGSWWRLPRLPRSGEVMVRCMGPLCHRCWGVLKIGASACLKNVGMSCAEGGLRWEECRSQGMSHDTGNLHARGGPCKPSFEAVADDEAIKPAEKERKKHTAGKQQANSRFIPFRLRRPRSRR
jgi:hypothetical protein